MTHAALPDDLQIRFFARDRAVFGFLSHFYPARILLDGETWPTVEHYYQAQKSWDPAYRQTIRSARSPGQAKRLAAHPDAPRSMSRHSWFRRHGALPRPDWGGAKLAIMRRADSAKFEQHAELAAALVATLPAALIEDSPFDSFWGIGSDGRGMNHAGRILMEIRAGLAVLPEPERWWQAQRCAQTVACGMAADL